MSVRMMGRLVPRMRMAPRLWGRRCMVLPRVHEGHVKHLHRGPFWRDPFSQMEEFRKDMEKKFKRDIEDTMGTFVRNVSINTLYFH